MRKVLLIAFLVAFAGQVKSQMDFTLSQFYHAPTQFNPAATGIYYGSYRFSAHHRIQWASISEPFTTTAASFDMPLFNELIGNDFIAVGVNAYQDEAGLSFFKSTRGNLNLNYGKSFDPKEEHFISMGLGFGFGQRTIDYSSLAWDRQWDITGYNLGLPNFEPGSASESVARSFRATRSGTAHCNPQNPHAQQHRRTAAPPSGRRRHTSRTGRSPAPRSAPTPDPRPDGRSCRARASSRGRRAPPPPAPRARRDRAPIATAVP